MAGIFSPTLDVGQTAIQPQSPVRPVDISTVTNSINGIFKQIGNSGGGDSQKARDNAALQPFVKEQTRLFKSRNSLKLRYRNQVKESFNNFIEKHPVLFKEARDLISEVHNIDVGAEFDPAVIERRNMIDYYTNDPEGKALLAEGIVFTNGEYDVPATLDKLQAIRYGRLKSKHDLATTKARVESAELSVKEKEIVKKEGSSILLVDQLKRSNDKVTTFLGTIKDLNIDFSDPKQIDDAIKMIDEQILVAKTQYTTEAGEAGISDVYDVDAAVAPLVRFKEFVENNRDNISKLETALTSKNRMELGKYIEATTGLPQLGKDPDFFKYLDSNVKQMILSDDKSVDALFSYLKTNLGKMEAESVWSDRSDNITSPTADPLVDPETGEAVDDPDPATSAEPGDVFGPELTEEINKMSASEKAESIRTLIAKVSAADTEMIIQNPIARREAAADLGKLIALTFDTNFTGVASPKVLNGLLAPKVLETYRTLLKSDPTIGAKLQSSFAMIFARNIMTRTNNIDERIRSMDLAKGLRWMVKNNDEVELHYNLEDPLLDARTKTYLESAIAAGYDTTLSSLVNYDEELRKANKNDMRFKSRVHKDLFSDVQKINQVNSVLKSRLPEIGNSKQWKMSIQNRFNTSLNTTSTIVDGSKINSMEELKRLGPGSYTVDFGGTSKPFKVIIDNSGEMRIIGDE